jgi:hypothetical protein
MYRASLLTLTGLLMHADLEYVEIIVEAGHHFWTCSLEWAFCQIWLCVRLSFKNQRGSPSLAHTCSAAHGCLAA